MRTAPSTNLFGQAQVVRLEQFMLYFPVSTLKLVGPQTLEFERLPAEPPFARHACQTLPVKDSTLGARLEGHRSNLGIRLEHWSLRGLQPVPPSD